VATVIVTITDRGVEAATQPEWDDESIVTCVCGRTGSVEDFYRYAKPGFTRTIQLGDFTLRFIYVGPMAEGQHVWRVKLNFNNHTKIAKRGSILTSTSEQNEVLDVFVALLNRWGNSSRDELGQPEDLVLFDEDWEPVLAYQKELKALI
jgi:hypothetical protein